MDLLSMMTPIRQLQRNAIGHTIGLWILRIF
jgi:hypothetical protein